MKNPFRTPSAQELAAKELENAQRDLLRTQNALEHYQAQEGMLIKRIARLRYKLEQEKTTKAAA